MIFAGPAVSLGFQFVKGFIEWLATSGHFPADITKGLQDGIANAEKHWNDVVSKKNLEQFRG